MTDYHAIVTPADVEFVPVENLTRGDVIVRFTALNVDLDVAPTVAQLRCKRTRYTEVINLITEGHLLSVNADQLLYALNVSARTWRVRRVDAR